MVWLSNFFFQGRGSSRIFTLNFMFQSVTFSLLMETRTSIPAALPLLRLYGAHHSRDKKLQCPFKRNILEMVY